MKIEFQWLCLTGRKVAHAIYPSSGVVAFCGVTPRSADPNRDWFGWESEEDAAKVELLPRCKTCVRLSDEWANR